MEYRVMAAIIGGGPSGMACAITMQKNREANCVIDRAVFPRPKTCAGLVTEKTYRLLEKLLSGETQVLAGLFCSTSSRAAVYDRHKMLAQAECDTAFRLCYRKDFDAALVRSYKDAGGMIFEGQRNYSIDYQNRCIRLENGDTVHYRYLIFADGAKSRAHRDFALTEEKMGFSVEVFIPGECLDRKELEIHFGWVSPGYVWLFPYGHQYSAGAISTEQNSRECMRVLKAFVSDLGISDRELSYRGAFVPYGKAVSQKRTPDNVLLIGDAGGFADPIYAEGLYMAAYTGMAAAEAVCGGAGKKGFLDSVRPLYRTIRSGAMLQKKLYRPGAEERFIRKIEGKNRFLSFYSDEQVSLGRYSHISLRMLRDYRASKHKGD